MAFLERTAAVEAPPELVTRILFEVSGPASAVKPTLARRLFGRVLGGWLEPILQPRMAMGMGVAALFFFMLRPSAPVDPIGPGSGEGVDAAENRVNRTWERGVKSYENIRLVYEIQTRLNEWKDEAPDAANAAAPNSSQIDNK